MIYTALVAPRPAAAIALHLGVSVPCVPKMLSLYQRFGPAALETPGSGGRRHQSLTIDEEQPFVAPFLQRAAAGEMATIRTSNSALDAYVHHPGHQTTSERVLARQGWRQMAPRARPPATPPARHDTCKTTVLPPSQPPGTRARPLRRDRSSRGPTRKAVSVAAGHRHAVPSPPQPHPVVRFPALAGCASSAGRLPRCQSWSDCRPDP